MIEATYTIDPELTATLAKLGNFKQLVRQPLKESAARMMWSIKQNFREEGRPEKWAENSMSTVLAWMRMRTGGRALSQKESVQQEFFGINARRARLRKFSSKHADKNQFGKKVGTFTGMLQKTMSSRVGDDDAAVFPTVAYGIKFQEGDPRKNQPPRPFMMFQDSDQEAIVGYFNAAIDRAIGGAA